MSSIMRARNGLTGRWEGPEVIGGSFLELKVAEPSMLGIGCPDRHALPRITPKKCTDRKQRSPPARAGSFNRRKAAPVGLAGGWANSLATSRRRAWGTRLYQKPLGARAGTCGGTF